MLLLVRRSSFWTSYYSVFWGWANYYAFEHAWMLQYIADPGNLFTKKNVKSMAAFQFDFITCNIKTWRWVLLLQHFHTHTDWSTCCSSFSSQKIRWLCWPLLNFSVVRPGGMPHHCDFTNHNHNDFLQSQLWSQMQLCIKFMDYCLKGCFSQTCKNSLSIHPCAAY